MISKKNFGAEISAKDLADLFGISDRSVRELHDRGIVKKSARGRYLLAESVQLYTAHLRGVAAGRGGKDGVIDLTVERARLAKEQADGQALKNAALRRELLPAADVEREWSDICRKVRAGVLAATSRVRSSAGLSAKQAVEMDSELRLALSELGNDHEYPPGSASSTDPSAVVGNFRL